VKDYMQCGKLRPNGQLCLLDKDHVGAHESLDEQSTKTDAVDHPAHYNSHPSGVECVTIAEHFCFNLGNAMKYIWRAGLKGDEIEDLKKARWYLDREISKREKKT
jgi:hypothetical protein